jgi:hypothetical protein
MLEMIALRGHGAASPLVSLAAQPVCRAEFAAYLHATGRPLPAGFTPGGDSRAPVTHVSQVDAAEYCRWLSAAQGPAYRLPRIAELHELADEITQEGISAELWPHFHQPHPAFRGGMKPTYLCEWTQETDEIPQAGGAAPRVLGSVFYPPWVRQSDHTAHAQAHLAANAGYSFVTFRLACGP